MTSSPLRFLLPVALAVLTAACATTPTLSSVPPAPEPVVARLPTLDSLAPPELTPAQRTELQLRVMTGELAAGRKQPEVAAREFLEALKITDDVDLAQRATSLALAARNEELAMQAAQRWQTLAPNEADPREVIARLALNKNDLALAYTHCEAIVSGAAGGPDEGFAQVAQILSQAGNAQTESALKLMTQLVEKWPQHAAAHHALGLLALRYNQFDLADKASQRALQLSPGSREELLLIAGVRVRQKRVDEADQIIEELLKTETNPADLRLGYAKLLLEAGERDRARAQLVKLLAASPGNQDARYALGVLAFNDRDYAEAAKNFQPLLASERGSEAAYQLGRIEENRKDYPKALSYYERVGEGAQLLDASVRRAAVMTRTGQVSAARVLMADLREQYPQFADRLYLSEAEMLSERGFTDQALALYASAFTKSPDNPELLYGRSLLYEKQSRIDLAEKDLRAILKADAGNARAMNALGYMLVVHTKRLKEAQKLIARAAELDPDDAAIMDSLGWVQYKLGQKEAARDTLRRAFEKFPDPEVAAHLGEVLWVLGEKEQAQIVWERALADDPDHQVLKETVQRFAR